VARLQARVNSFDPSSRQALYRSRPGHPRPRDVLDVAHLHNPYDGVPFAWQLTETVDSFLARLPPRTTMQSMTTPWIFICNPYIRRKARVTENSDGSVAEKGKGNEDEGPSEEASKVGLVVEAGLERLDLLREFTEKTKTMARNPAAAEKEMNKERKKGVEDILTLAHAAKVRAGKVSHDNSFPRISTTYTDS
jgi:Domain of unknown function (DUF1917)